MMKAIRWSGVIAFIIIFGGLIGGSLLFVEPIVESMIESTLTDMNEAQVDVGSVDISYSPLALSVRDIQVTDPAHPMVNSVDIGQARFALSFGDLWLKKVIIDDMSLSGIRVDTPRKKSGAIKKAAKPKVATEEDRPLFEIPMLDMQLPDVKQLLKTEPLSAEKLINELNQDVEKTRQQWAEMRDEIDDKQRWESYRTRYEQISLAFKADTAQKLKAIEDAKELRKDLKQEAARIRQTRDRISADSNRLEDEFKAAKAAPGQDIQRIKDKYSIDQLNAENITQMLFGPRAAEYLGLAQTWYARIKPYIKSKEKEQKVIRLKGENIAFREYHPKPGFYVARATIDAQVPRGQFAGSITDVSSDQSVSKKPTRFKLSGQNMRHRDSEQLSGEFNYIQPDRGFTRIEYSIRGYQLTDFDISRSDKLSLKMNSSLMDLSLSTRLQGGEISGRSDVDFSKVQFNAGTDSSGSLARMLAAAFADVRDFNIEAKFRGDLKDIDIEMKSSLDNQIGQQFKAQVNARKQQFERELKAAIDVKLREPMTRLEASKQQLDQVQAELQAKQQELEQKIADLDSKIDQQKNIKKQELDDKADKKKDELKKKLLDKLKL
jgi:uncharacterized protein (TIGR03545 family)